MLASRADVGSSQGHHVSGVKCCGSDGIGARLPVRWPGRETEKDFLFTVTIGPG